jgi:hypothetical protein
VYGFLAEEEDNLVQSNGNVYEKLFFSALLLNIVFGGG